MSYQAEINAELENAEQARARGNEGQARVCARRAAGIAIREYMTQKGVHLPSRSAIVLLDSFKDDPLLPPPLKLIARHLTLHVTEEHKLPVDADLVAEARLFCDALLKERP